MTEQPLSSQGPDEAMLELYQQLILEHAKSPRNFRRLPNATHVAEGINPLCGDKIHLYLDVSDNGTIADVSFEGSGCAISMASTSLMTETIAAMSLAEATACRDGVIQRLADGDDITLPSSAARLKALEGVRRYPSRVKCATLAWQTLASAMASDTTTATTE